ncbi:MAG TPA: lytic murein transglycosylase B [Mariprofundaceae bacterium]|nr:lytic murein transglycosylase B [Mariprofundaceae bacterium]
MKTGPAPDLLRRHLMLGLGSLPLLAVLPASAAALTKPQVDLTALAGQLAAQTGLKAAAIEAILAQAEFKPDVIDRILTPYESKPYAVYRPLFVTEQMRVMGEEYLRDNRATLDAAADKYGIEPEIVAAILGMETRFGRYKGKDRVLDSLFTLATGYPKRADFFRRELGEFLLMCQEERLNPTDVMGSYAGAFGATQFIPSSYRGYAVDADKDGRRDVWNSPADIIGSVANYFSRHGWQRGRPVAHWLPTRKSIFEERARENFSHWTPLADLRRYIHTVPPMWQDDDKVAVIEMQTSTGMQYALVQNNFYVITRWNRSYNYAMATTEIAAMLGCKTCAVS